MPEPRNTILIVDDSKISRKKLQADISQSLCLRFVEAADAAEAERYMEESRPQLILLDLTLPDRNGADLLKEWREDPELASIPILIVTGSEDEAVMDHCFTYGADDFIGKPWKPIELAARVRSHLRRGLAEGRLRQTEAIFNETQRMANIGGWEVDLATQELVWTPEVYRIVDMPRDHKPNLASTFESYPPEERPRVQAIVENAMRTGAAFDFESKFSTAKGRHIWIRARGQAQMENGKAVKLWGTFQDITEEHEIREALRVNEERLAMTMEATADGLWDWNISEKTVYANARWMEMYGHERVARTVPETLWRDAIHPDDAPAVMDAVNAHFVTGEPYEVEFRIRHTDGHWVWILARGRVVEWGDNDEPVRMVGTNIDITARKLAEEERDLIFKMSLDMLCTAGFDGRFKQVNPAWTHTLGWSAEELLARPFLEFVHPEDVENTVNVMKSLSGGDPLLGFENRYLHKDGSYRWISWNSYPIVEENLICAVARDVTEHKEYQDRLAFDASHDLLTKLYNRSYLLDELTHQAAFARRYGQPLTFCLCDLDHFKSVNDTHGHQTGDAVLSRFATILTQSVRDSDIVGRYGGEEFGIVFPGTDAEGAAHCMERALETLRQTEFEGTAGATFTVTATFGVAEFDKAQEPAALIAAADQALYRGKGEGRNRVVLAT